MANITFITAINLLDRFGDKEISQRADPESNPGVTPSQLRITAESGDRTSWSTDLITQADNALARVQRAVDTANGLVTGAVRSGAVLPADVVPVSIPEDAKFHALNIARYSLWDDNYPEYIRVAYEDAKEWLKMVSTGRISLDFGLSTGPQGGGFSMIDTEYPLMNTNQSAPIGSGFF